MTGLSDGARRNPEGWTKANADYTDAQARLRSPLSRAGAARIRS
jgi:hypothetical protein